MTKGLILEGVDAQAFKTLNKRIERLESQINLLVSLKKAEVEAEEAESEGGSRLTVAQTCKMLGRSRSALYKYIDNGQIRRYSDQQGAVYFKKLEVIALQEALKKPTRKSISELLDEL